MNCEQTDNLIINYLYGELDSGQAREVEAHIEGCAVCAAKLAEYNWVRESVAKQEDPAPSNMTVNKILAVAREEAETPKSFWRFSWIKILAPICALAIVGGFVLFQYQTGMLSRQTLVAPTDTAAERAPAVTPAETATAPTPPPAPQPVKEAETPPRPVFRGGGPTIGTEAGTDEMKPAETAMPNKVAEEADSSIKVAERQRSAWDRIIHTIPDETAGGSVVASRTVPNRTTRDLAIDEALVEEPSAPACKPVGESGETRAVPMDPELTTWLASRMTEGKQAMDSGDFEKAGEVFRAVLHRLPEGHKDRPTALLWLAQAYEKLGFQEKALQTYRLLALECPDQRSTADKKIEELSGK